ncbi:hypothetical protein [Lutibacter sp.]|uniref:hypothetical protein n=1 Tax=Lutibacter sp. TaxID=1925666 RepID=UPI0025B81CDC|nr:hypothetical protein [Lutibacter sp.]MCF6182124.1 hypothetical protein [Lutibacter sp.]
MINKYLKQFCIAISSDNELSKTSFLNLYENSITHFTPYLKTEIQENILNLDKNKHSYYLDYVINQIKKTPFFNTSENQFDKFLLDYKDKMDISNFPYFKNNLSNDLNTFINPNFFEPTSKNLKLENLQQNAFSYASMLEAKKIIEYAENEKTKLDQSHTVFKKIKWVGKPSQLGFIIGVLADLDYIEAPKRKSNDINYTQFAKQIKDVFEIKTTESTLSKYLNLDSEKAQETKRKFEKENFHIPNRKIIS